MAELSTSRIDEALVKVKFAQQIHILRTTLKGDPTLSLEFRKAALQTLTVPFDDETTDEELLEKCVKAGLRVHDDNHVRVEQFLERLLKKNYPLSARKQALADLFATDDLPTQSTDGNDGDLDSLARTGVSTVQRPFFPSMAQDGASRRGHALIVNVANYTDPALNRQGSCQDVERLKQLFSWLSFEVTCLPDLQGNLLRGIEEALSKLVFNHTDWFVCVLMSHGTAGRLISSNNEVVQLDDIFQLTRDPYTTVPVELLTSDLPKLFFVEACRRPVSVGAHAQDSIGSASDSSLGAYRPKNVCGDSFVCAYATRHGESAHRLEESGSVFIRVLDECLRERVPKREHLLDILTHVVRLCKSEKVSLRLADGVLQNSQQTPAVESQVGKFIYFDFK